MYGIVNGTLGWLYAKAGRTRAETAGQTTIFRFAPYCELLFFVVLFAGASAVVAGIWWKARFWGVFGLLFTAGSIVGWPNIILADGLELKSTQFLRNARKIPWSTIKSAQFNTANHVTTITSCDGTRIYHTGFHCDPKLFHQLVDERSPVEIDRVEPSWTGRRNVI